MRSRVTNLSLSLKVGRGEGRGRGPEEQTTKPVPHSIVSSRLEGVGLRCREQRAI